MMIKIINEWTFKVAGVIQKQLWTFFESDKPKWEITGSEGGGKSAKSTFNLNSTSISCDENWWIDQKSQTNEWTALYSWSDDIHIHSHKYQGTQRDIEFYIE